MFRLALFLTALGLCPSALAQPEFVQLIAGLGVPGNQPGLTSNLGAVGGVAFDGAGNIYLSLTSYGIVERLGTSGNLSRFAGNGMPGFAGDGEVALTAQFSAPTALAFDGAGNLYIADTGNKRIRKVAVSTGIVTTVAGGGSQSESSNGVLATSVSLGQIGGLASDFAGNLYVSSGCRIRKVSDANGLISTVVGTGVCGFGGDQGAALSAQISSAASLALDTAGNLYLTDGNRVRAVDARSGLIETLAGTGTAGYGGDNGPATAAMLSAPASMAVDSQFNVFIADTANQRIRRIDGKSSIITTVVGTGTAGSTGDNGLAIAAALNTPKSIAVDSGGNLIIADSGNGVIRRVSGSSLKISSIAGSGSGSFGGDSGPAASAQFAGLRGIALDSAGNIYLADTGNCRVRRIDAASGLVSTVAGSGVCGTFSGDGGPATAAALNAPGDVAIDHLGNLLIADTGNARVRMVDASTKIITTVAGGGTGNDGVATDAKLVSPGGLAVDSVGNLFISDSGDNRVRKVAAGNISTVAGTGTAGFGGDGGPASAALLNAPAGIAVNSAGTVFYIADNGNNRIRKVDAGNISTVAGTGAAGFGGDGGLAVNALLASPRGVALDSAGNLWISDEANNRIRMIDTSGTINTVVGDGTQNSSGDGGLSTGAEVNHPWGLAILPTAQTVYFSENGSSRLRALVPLSTAFACTIRAFPSSLAAAPAGGSITVQLFTSSLACGWAVSNLPDWISAFPASGAGNATVVLTVNANAGAARTATLGLASSSFLVTQAAAQPSCSFVVSPTVASYTAAGGSSSFSVDTAAGCAWQVLGAPSWLSFTGATSGSGPGSVSLTAPANTGARRNASFAIAGQTVLVEQNGAQAAAAGMFSQFASGAGWQTGFTLVNTGYVPASGQINFYDESGKPLPGNGTSSLPVLTAPNSLLSIAAPNETDTAAQQGWAQLFTDGNVNGYEVFRIATSDGFLEAFAAPETRILSSYMLPFDTTDGHEYGIALVNSSEIAGGVSVSATDAVTGVLLFTGRNVVLPSLGHSSFVLTAQYPELVNTRGVLRFSSFFAGQVNVLALRLKSGQSLTSVPVFTPGSSPALEGFTDAGILPQIVSGGGWSTTLALVNTGSTKATARLEFHDDQGAPLPLTLKLPLVPAAGSGVAPSTHGTIAPGAMILIEASGDQVTRAGWASLVAEGSVSAYALLAYSNGTETREAATPVFIPAANTYLLPFDNTNGYATGVALANNSAQAANVLATLRDANGKSISSETISLPAWGHNSFVINGRYPVSSNTSGSVEFSSPVSGQIGVLGIRAGSNRALTAVPALARQ